MIGRQVRLQGYIDDFLRSTDISKLGENWVLAAVYKAATEGLDPPIRNPVGRRKKTAPSDSDLLFFAVVQRCDEYALAKKQRITKEQFARFVRAIMIDLKLNPPKTETVVKNIRAAVKRGDVQIKCA